MSALADRLEAIEARKLEDDAKAAAAVEAAAEAEAEAAAEAEAEAIAAAEAAAAEAIDFDTPWRRRHRPKHPAAITRLTISTPS